jgi:branched-chain amino acid transport system permease protein
VTYALKLTLYGKAIRAVANDPKLALVSGIDSEKMILYTFLLGSALAGIAALLIAWDSALTPLMGLNALFMGIVAMILGGVGSLPGSLLGGLLLGLLQSLTVWLIGSQWQLPITFTILLLFLLFRPVGLLGQPREARI